MPNQPTTLKEEQAKKQGGSGTELEEWSLPMEDFEPRDKVKITTMDFKDSKALGEPVRAVRFVRNVTDVSDVRDKASKADDWTTKMDILDTIWDNDQVMTEEDVRDGTNHQSAN